MLNGSGAVDSKPSTCWTLLDPAENVLTPVMPITSHPVLRHLSAF